MAYLIYSAIASLDGFTADSNGNFDWAAPDEGGAPLRNGVVHLRYRVG